LASSAHADNKKSAHKDEHYTSICEIAAHRKTWSNHHFRIKARYWWNWEHHSFTDARCPKVLIWEETSRVNNYDKSVLAFKNHWHLDILEMMSTNMDSIVDASVIFVGDKHAGVWGAGTVTFTKIWSYKDIRVLRFNDKQR
jgi:hypothetical protein